MPAKSVTPDRAAAAVSRLALMAFFPTNPEVQTALVEILLEMVDTDEHLDWLMRRLLVLPKWPGVGEMRALYCSRYKPKDGLEAYSDPGEGSR